MQVPWNINPQALNGLDMVWKWWSHLRRGPPKMHTCWSWMIAAQKPPQVPT